MASLFPEGLTAKEFSLLSQCVDKTAAIAPAELLSCSAAHLEKIRQAHAQNAFINLKPAEAICLVFNIIIQAWDDLPPHSHSWLKGMMEYFSLSSDLESDFTSPIGFDDDVKIMNACLKLANREDLCLNAEDFDDV
jgi:uncharacterized membrane protein YkvA (DUF1232 family)